MNNIAVEFTVPLTLSDNIFVRVSDGRVFKITLPDHIEPGDRVTARIDDDIFFIIVPEIDDPEGSPSLLPVGELFDGSVEEVLIPASTISDSPMNGSSLFAAAAKNPIVAAVLEEAKKVDETYNITGSAKHVAESTCRAVETIDKKYLLTEKAKHCASLVATKVNEADTTLGISKGVTDMDKQYRISERVTGVTEKAAASARDLDNTYHVTDTMKATPGRVVETLSDLTTSLSQQAQQVDEKYHVRDNMQAATDRIVSTAKEVDEKYHVTDTLKDIATSISQEVAKFTTPSSHGNEVDDEEVTPLQE